MPGDSLDVGPISFEVRYIPAAKQSGGASTDSTPTRQIPTVIADGTVVAEPGGDLAETHFVDMEAAGEMLGSPLNHLSDEDAETRLADEEPDDAGPILNTDGSPDLSWMERT